MIQIASLDKGPLERYTKLKIMEYGVLLKHNTRTILKTSQKFS